MSGVESIVLPETLSYVGYSAWADARTVYAPAGSWAEKWTSGLGSTVINGKP